MKKTVVITGASGKLGSAIARHLASLGWNLVLTSRDTKTCAALAEELRRFDISVDTVALDLLDETSAETLVSRVADIGAKVTHIVSNARSLDTLELDENGLAPGQKFIDEFAIDVVAPYRILMSFARDNRHDLRGVVTIGSQYGEVAPTPALYDGDLSRSPIQYGVAKAALHHMTRELSVRLSPNIRVNAIAFGGFEGRTDPAFQERYAKLLPLGRMLTDADAGGPVAFLLDDVAAAAVTGHVLSVDGGWSVW